MDLRIGSDPCVPHRELWPPPRRPPASVLALHSATVQLSAQTAQGSCCSLCSGRRRRSVGGRLSSNEEKLNVKKKSKIGSGGCGGCRC